MLILILAQWPISDKLMVSMIVMKLMRYQLLSTQGQLLSQHCVASDSIITCDLPKLTSNSHVEENTLSCDPCDETFLTNKEQLIHTQNKHGQTEQLLSQHCQFCDSVFETCDQLNHHIGIVHASCSPPIPQLDGPIDEPSTDLIGPAPSSGTCRTARYTLNQQKQTDKIRDDAVIDDYEINVNNKDQNVTVKCSSGFYLQVARAYLGYLKDKSVLSCEGIAIVVDKSVVTKDQLGTEATKQISLTFMSNQRFLGGVSVHLHHSTRTVQIQGSAIMPDNSRAALWFLKKCILVQFKIQAKEKHFMIKNTNATFLDGPSNQPANKNIHTQGSHHSNNCSYCNCGFNTQSKPSRCSLCENYFHKSTCIKDHMKTCKTSSGYQGLPSISSRTSSRTSATTSPPTYSQASFPNLKSTLTTVAPLSISFPTAPH